ncbi:hypothetical protein EVA_06166 [gut metagenome]|uniref:Uncharacterized protein n=1 Tax=gut metagenome TaxID=749906 RepID=J9CZL5_9ZZZZ
MQVKSPVHIAGNFLSQLLQACICGVSGLSLFQTLDACIPDTPGCFKIGLAHTQTDAVIHFGSNIKKLSDAGRAHGSCSRRNNLIVIHHWVIHSLSSISSSL